MQMDSKTQSLASLRHPSLFVVLMAVMLATGGCQWFQEVQLRPQLDKAAEAFRNRDYALAAARYESLVDRYPQSEHRELLLIRHGISLYTLRSYHEAQVAFTKYLREYPMGKYAKDAQTYLNKIETLLSPRSPVQQEALEQAREDLNKLQKLRLEHPHDPEVLMALGNLYYELGDYQEAVRQYYEAQKLDAAYEEKKLIQQRMMLDEDGNPIPVTPAEIRRIERENQPLVIFDTHDYKSRDWGGETVISAGRKRFFNVTGLVRNQSSRLLHNVVIEVRFLNDYNNILDVEQYRIGSMAPNEVRPFRVESDSYDNIYNITHFAAIARWED